MWISIWIMPTVIDLLDMNANFRVERMVTLQQVYGYKIA